jgi:hypothetical protein
LCGLSELTEYLPIGRVAGQISTNHPIIPQPQTPSRHSTASRHPPLLPETPRKRKENANQRLRGIKTKMPENLSLDAIRTRFKSVLKLSYTPDDWQVHLIRRILQGYDSIFSAGTGYGKSLIFEALAVLGGAKKLVIVISPLKALEHNQVFKLSFGVITTLNVYFQAEHAVEKGIDAVVINEDTSKISFNVRFLTFTWSSPALIRLSLSSLTI